MEHPTSSGADSGRAPRTPADRPNGTPWVPATRPAEISYKVSLVELAERMSACRGIVVQHDCGVRSVDPDELRAACLGELACQETLHQRALAGRWLTVIAAFRCGASVEDVSQAVCLDADEIQAGLREWAARQHRMGLISGERYAAVLAVAERVVSA